MSDPRLEVLIAYEAVGVSNPVSLAGLDRVLDQAGPAQGARVLDLGCGNAEVARHVARRYAVEVEAVERSPAVYAIAQRRTAAFEGPGRVRLHNARSRAFLPGIEPFDLVLALGVSGVVEGPPEPERVLTALRPHVRPGGWLAWGEAFLKREPSPGFAAAVAPYAAYRTHTEYVAAAESVGLEVWSATVSPDSDWDTYVWDANVAVQSWLLAHPDHPEAETVRQRMRFTRTIYLAEGRDTLGFGLYLLRNPG